MSNASNQVLIRDLLALPDQIRKGDFVLSLTEGVKSAEQTVSQYALTPNLVDAFDQALGAINSAMQSSKSQGLYLHGSFGSGKSHFMAMLDLMLTGHLAPWRRAELHPLKNKYSWIGTKKVLMLPMHMIGAKSIEEKLFSSYVAWVSEKYPQALVPALYKDEALFDSTRKMRAKMGDEAFFALLNKDVETDEDWGDMADSRRWDAASLDAAMGSSNPAERGKAFGTLAHRLFEHVTEERDKFIDLDNGLAVLSQHAQSLGYDVVVPLFDELILWLASLSEKKEFVQQEAQKLAKLKEAQNMNRPIPLVSFVARQRDLAELVGKDALGVEQKILQDSLAWSSGRFEEIKLEDRNLPAIIERRVVQPKDAQAKQMLEDGFAKMQRALKKPGTDALMAGIEALTDINDFKKMYPFSPTLVAALVALSESLQRERTAIRLLMELLVEHMPELKLGQLVAVGDLFDALAGSGDDPTDGVMRDRFRRARSLYMEHILPMLQEKHDTKTEAKCQRLRADHPTKLGCSRCEQMACRNDNRLLKTVLLAALVPNAAPFKNLSVSKVVYYNHGAITSPIPAQEVSIAATRFQTWAAKIGQLRVGNEKDPSVEIRLDSIDLSPIIDRAKRHDTLFARRQMVRKLLFELLKLPAGAAATADTVDVAHTWRGLERRCQVRVAVLRDVSEAQLFSQGHACVVVIDYPFDTEGDHPTDPLQRLEQVREHRQGEVPAVVWRPIPFKEAFTQALGELTLLDHIYQGRQQKYFGHLRAEDRPRAETQLENLWSQKKKLLQNAMLTAYGLSTLSKEDEQQLDVSRKPKDHYFWLSTDINTASLSLTSDLGERLKQLFERLIHHRFPHHPDFGSSKLGASVIKQNREVLERLLDQETRKTTISIAERAALEKCALPLGLVSLSDSAAHLTTQRLAEIDQRLDRSGLKNPSFAKLKELIDPNGHQGLSDVLLNLIVLVYGQWSGRAIRLQNKLIEPSNTALDAFSAHAILEQPDMPSPAEWSQAIKTAQLGFGVAIQKTGLTVGNLQNFSSELDTKIHENRGAANKLVDKLSLQLQTWTHLPHDTSPRLQTAQDIAKTLNALAPVSPAQRVRILAEWTPQTSPHAAQHSLHNARSVCDLLTDESRWAVFNGLHSLLHEAAFKERAADILDKLSQTLREDEINTPLAKMHADLSQQVGTLLATFNKTRAAAASPQPAPHLIASSQGPHATLQVPMAVVDSAQQAHIDANSPAEALPLITAALQKALKELDPNKPVHIAWTISQRGGRP